MVQQLRGLARSRWLIRAGTSICLMLMAVAGLAMIVLIPSQGAVTIRIATDPPDATVQIDGVTIGESPINTIVPDGEHDLIVSRAGYKVIDRKIFADPSAPPQCNQYAFGLVPSGEPLSVEEKSRRIASLERLAEEAFRRGDYVAPESDNAWYYLNQLQELDPSNRFISEMRQRIRRVLKQQAETAHQRNDLG